MEVFTSEEDSPEGVSSWEVGLGRVLAAFWHKDWSALETNLQVKNSDLLTKIQVFLCRL